uniref:Uncharacterized protein n=1 Tax=Siphoviridae sp. cte421 TaxID=2826402 RepID=A0A8S5M9J9_9CAUD|nr:MAG TPA: hypothetical protein [Siphoviridae sp. cte421]DAJ92634.1 MAG TPA: hypothetical protein [Caudoviricetes sp.]DAZ42366.1 MAG TPA: hypothetical protein [Caudoviricetes sp.]
MGCGRDSAWLLLSLMRRKTAFSSQYRMAANSHKLHNILRSSLCNI